MTRKSGFFFWLLTSVFFSACSQTNLETQQKETIILVINSFIKNDTLKLYSLIDTGLTKDQFAHDIEFLNEKLAKTKLPVNIDSIKTTSGLLKDDQNYMLRIYVDKERFDYVDLFFAFNKNTWEHIHYFQKVIQLKEKDFESIKPPPKF